MLPLETIRNALHGADLILTTDEQSVVTMACHLTALHIASMESVEDRRTAVASLPPSLSDAIKAEIVQEFNRKKATSSN